MSTSLTPLGIVGFGAFTVEAAQKIADAIAQSGGGGGGLVVPKTANYVLQPTDSGIFLTNTGAGGEVDFTLPAPASSLRFTFYVDNAHTVKIIASGGAKIRFLATLSAASGNVQSAAQGNKISVICIGNSSADGVPLWVVDTIFGVWTIT